MNPMRCSVTALCLTMCLAAQAQGTATSSPPAYPTGNATALGAQIEALLADPAVARAHWGIAVTTMDGTPLYGLDEGKMFRPASVAKLFTTSAAMALLGPEKTFDTRIYGVLDPTNGTVQGDLLLVGGGDADFASGDLPYASKAPRDVSAPNPPALADLQQMADQLAARGVKRVTGQIVGDETLFPWEPYPESWAADDLLWGFGAPVSALTIADNQLKLTVTPLKPFPGPGHPINAKVELDQFSPYYSIDNEVETTAVASQADGVKIERDPGSRVLRVFGSIASTAAPEVDHVAIEDPGLYAAMALHAMLISRGVNVRGVPKRDVEFGSTNFLPALRAPLDYENNLIEGKTAIADCMLRPPYAGTLLASHTSAPLSEDVVFALKESQNLHAELLLHHLASLYPCPHGSTVSGARIARAFLLRAGLSPDDFVFYDGSGLSAKDLVTPRATAQLLAFAATQPWFAQWKPALPVGGIDGTLANRFTAAPLKGHVFAKTGTLGESRALAGYLDAASGRTLIFSILVDNHTPGSNADRAVMDKIVAAIAAAN